MIGLFCPRHYARHIGYLYSPSSAHSLLGEAGAWDSSKGSVGKGWKGNTVLLKVLRREPSYSLGNRESEGRF